MRFRRRSNLAAREITAKSTQGNFFNSASGESCRKTHPWLKLPYQHYFYHSTTKTDIWITLINKKSNKNITTSKLLLLLKSATTFLILIIPQRGQTPGYSISRCPNINQIPMFWKVQISIKFYRLTKSKLLSKLTFSKVPMFIKFQHIANPTVYQISTFSKSNCLLHFNV